MRYLLVLVVCLFSVGLAHADWPFADTKAADWPFKEKPCDCNPCTCDPASCKCAACANGCRKAGSAAQEEVAFVGFETAQAAQATQVAQGTAQGFHTEYRQVCNGTSCQMVAVSVPDGAAYAAGNCATCATGNCATGNCGASGSSEAGGCGASGRSGPLRRVFGRLFRGRRCGG